MVVALLVVHDFEAALLVDIVAVNVPFAGDLIRADFLLVFI